jgi:protein ImuA
VALAALRHWLMRERGWSANVPARLSFGLCALDSHLPNGGLGGAALHEIVPATQAAFPAALGFATAVLARFISSSPDSPSHPHRRQKKIVFVTPVHALRQYGLRQCDRLCGHLSSHVSAHGLYSLGFDPRRAIIVNPAHRQDALWALVESLRSRAPQAVVGIIDQLNLKTSQKLHLAAVDAGLPLLLLRPSQNLESSAAATRWRIAAAPGARDRFGSYARARWRLKLERCRNGRPGEWVVEYDHVAHCFSLVAALADLSFSLGAGDQPRRQAS